VTLTLSSFTTTLSSATISWYVDGTLATKGVGLSTFSLSAGKAGSSHSVRASIAGTDGSSGSVTTVIKPATVALLYEAATYTPAFYRGRSLASANAPVRVHADAQFASSNGVAIPTSSINYTWSLNGRAMQNLSGLGKADLTLSGPSLYGTLIVSVDASSGGVHGSAVARIPAVSPKVLLYSDDPLLGMLYRSAISATTNLRADQSTLVAEPYFFAVSSPVSSDLIYSWGVNGTPVLADKESPSRITLQVAGGGASTAGVSLSLIDSRYSFETAKQGWQVHITSSSGGANSFTPTK
jgi:hypothetical protein